MDKQNLSQMKLFTLILLTAAQWMIISPIKSQSRIIEFETPKMKIFLPPNNTGNGKAIVACPGGGYSHLAQNHEGYYWAPFFNNLGFAYAVVEYRMPNGDKSIPMNDVKQCFQIITDSAAAWKIDPEMVGIMGSSAGGHLASAIATHPTKDCNPYFQILFYPVISLESEITHRGTRKGFLGENPTKEEVKEWSSDQKITQETPPTFIALCSDDKVVKPVNSLLYYKALIDNKVPAAMFIYPTGGHGWGYRTKFKQHDQMLQELTAWLKTIKNKKQK